MFDLLIKGGVVIDPANGLHAKRDLAIAAGKIVEVFPEIAASQSRRVVDAKGQIVTPG